MEPLLEDVLEKAARLQELVPGAVLVGGSAAALHAQHRESRDHDHVVSDLEERFDSILENLEALGDWSTARVQPGKIILGELGGIETGVRQLLRERPLESAEVEVRGKRLLVPTAAEILRIKAWLALQRNQTRDYLDIAALADRIGLEEAAAVLRGIDVYYADVNRRPEAVATQLVRQLADPRPRDVEVTAQLAIYKALDPRWHQWSAVTAVLADLARRIAR
jgi:Nucleotidyl transferase AbiEii toxin, Type IV TA system